MPKIHISNFTRIPFEIPLVDLTEDKDKKGLQTFKNISKKQNEGTLQLYAYYRYPNRNFPEGREQFSIFFYNNNRIYICGGLTVKMGIMPIWYLNMDKLEWNKVPQKENTNNRFGHTSHKKFLNYCSGQNWFYALIHLKISNLDILLLYIKIRYIFMEAELK